jgi:hypothetical protein
LNEIVRVGKTKKSSLGISLPRPPLLDDFQNPYQNPLFFHVVNTEIGGNKVQTNIVPKFDVFQSHEIKNTKMPRNQVIHQMYSHSIIHRDLLQNLFYIYIHSIQYSKNAQNTGCHHQKQCQAEFYHTHNKQQYPIQIQWMKPHSPALLTESTA